METFSQISTIYVAVDDPTPSGACGQCPTALNPDGTVKWGALPHALGFSSPSVGLDGTIYVQGYAVNPDGSVKWADPGTFSSASIGSDGTIYGSLGADGHGVYAINSDGTVIWTFPATTTDMSIGSDGTVYFGSAGILYALNHDGSVKWSFNVGFTGCPPDLLTLISACDPVIGSNETIYIGSTDGSLYAIGWQNGIDYCERPAPEPCYHLRLPNPLPVKMSAVEVDPREAQCEFHF